MLAALPLTKTRSLPVSSITAVHFIPPHATLSQLRARAAHCTACSLYLNATQTVFGEGPEHASIMLVGEALGDREDLVCHPFIGPAGQLLDSCLKEAGIDRAEAYVTNVVKHFKFEQHGKRRLHKKPNTTEIRACRPWVEAEIARVKPNVLVCLGATAAQFLLGPTFRVTQSRGKLIKSTLAPYVLATVHPASILRADDRAKQTKLFTDDLRVAAKALK